MAGDAGERVGMKLYPWEYTVKEGGPLQIWNGSPVTKEQLRDSLNQTGQTLINGEPVHSLIFGATYWPSFARWDCINGWTTSLAEARDEYPKGQHAKKPFYWRLT